MVVITLSDCPPKVRGDLSKWLCEVNTGVYVGNVSTRVREELWMRVCENLKTGRATMVFHTTGEQQFDFKVHNARWEPVDLDGIKLMRHPLPARRPNSAEEAPVGGHTSKAGKMLEARRIQAAQQRKDTYVVLDIETSGLSVVEDRIIEIAALRVTNGEVVERFQTLVAQEFEIDPKITELTGLDTQMLRREGIPIQVALEKLTTFVAKDPILCHNADFDCAFLRQEAKRNQIKLFKNPTIDTLAIARKRLHHTQGYALTALCEHFGIDVTGAHRAEKDCELAKALYDKLNEI